MGDVLVRKSMSIQQQPGQPPSVFLDPFASGSKGNALPLRNPTGLDRTPKAAAAAMQAGAEARANLARMPSSGSVDDPNVRRQIGIQRSRAKDAVRDAAPRSVQEQVAVSNFNRLNEAGYDSEVIDRAAERAGKVGVLGARAGKFAGGALGLLAGATALSDASAAGQDFTTGLMGAGLTGATTYAQTAPTLGKYGARVGGRIGVRNQLRDEMKDAQFAAKQPVAVAPPTASTTASTTASPTKPVFPSDSMYINHGTPNARLRHSSRTPEQLQAAKEHIETSVKFGGPGGPTQRQKDDLLHIDRQLNPTTAGQPFNPQVGEGAMAEMFGPRASYTPGSSQFNVPSVASPVTAEPTQKPVAVQQKITTPKQAEAALFGEDEETEGGAKPALEGASAAAQTAITAFNEQEQQQPPIQELKNKKTEPGQTGVSGA